jgi:hypothetical protein
LRSGEVRRRTKVIGRFPGETSCLSLCWAVIDLVITHATNITFTDLEQLALQRIAHARTATPTKEVSPPNVQPAQREPT